MLAGLLSYLPAAMIAVHRSAAVRCSLLAPIQLWLELHRHSRGMQHRLCRWWHRVQPQGERRNPRVRERTPALTTHGVLAGAGRAGERWHELFQDKLGRVRLPISVHLQARPVLRCGRFWVVRCVHTTSALDCVITTPAGIGRLAKPWHRWQEAWVVTRAWQMPMNHLPLPNQPRGRRLSGQLRRASHLPLTPRALVRNQMTATRVVLDATAQCWCCRDFEMYRAKVQRWGDSCEPTGGPFKRNLGAEKEVYCVTLVQSSRSSGGTCTQDSASVLAWLDSVNY